MRKSVWSKVIIHMMLLLAYVAPAQASLIVTSVETQAVMDDLLVLAKNRDVTIQGELDPIKARAEARQTKKALLAEIDEDLAQIKNPTRSIKQIREVYRMKVIFNGRQKVSQMKTFVATLGAKDLDALVADASNAEPVYRSRLFVGYSSLTSTAAKREMVSNVLEKEFRGQQSKALTKIDTMSREDFVNELDQSRQIISSKDHGLWTLLTILLLAALIVAIAIGGSSGHADDGYGGGGGNNSCTYGSRGTYWQQYDSWREYNCAGYDAWGNPICRYYDCYAYQRYDRCTGTAWSPAEYKTDCY